MNKSESNSFIIYLLPFTFAFIYMLISPGIITLLAMSLV